MTKAKTIQIFLPNGDPKSAKIAQISSELGKIIFCSRKNIDFLRAREENNYVGIYFLFGKTDAEKPSVYIGEAEKLFDRLKIHLSDKDKEWFSSIIFYTTKDNSFDKALVKYFESYCIEKATESNRYTLENKKASSRSNISEGQEADIENYFESLKLLMSTIGYPLFDKLSTGKRTYYIKYKKLEARGEYTDEGFVIKEGSQVSGTFRESAAIWRKNKRAELLKEKIIEKQDDHFVFTQDYLFGSPSSAAMTIYGGAANGWTSWKTKEGKTLDEIERNKNV